MLVAAIKIVQQRHHQEMNVWLLPWLKIFYWLAFFLLSEAAILFLEAINPGNSWFDILQSTSQPEGVAYANTLNAILLGIIVAFPTKIFLLLLARFIVIPKPFSTFAETLLDKPDEWLSPARSMHKHAVPPEFVHWANETHRLGQLGDHQGALRAADEAVRICPHSAVAHNNRGCALANLGRYEEAIEEFQRAQDLIKENIAAGVAVPDPYPDPVDNLRNLLLRNR
jgi:tetratricopeptide (TPR) repeat protein